MKRIAVVAVILLALLSVGCATIKVGGNAQLGSSNDPGVKVAQKRCWYVLWGLVPINDNSTDKVVPANKTVRVETKYTPVDFILNFFTSIVTVYSNTAEVYEINSKRTDSNTQKPDIAATDPGVKKAEIATTAGNK